MTVEPLLPPALSRHWYNAAHSDLEDPWAGLEPRRTAVVLVDLIAWQVSRDGYSDRAARAAGRVADADHKLHRVETVVVPTLVRVLTAARSAGATVVHARLASRAADCSDIVPALRAYVAAAGAHERAPAARPLPALHHESDLDITKSGSGAFGSSDLDLVLRRRSIRTLLLAGVATDKCVLLTAAAGFDLGYEQFLLTDGTAAYNDDDQRAAERLMAGYLARPVTGAESVEALRSPDPNRLG